MRQRIGEQSGALVHDVAAQKLIDARAVGALGLQGPGRRQHLRQGGFGFLGQDEAAQAALGVGQSGGDGVVAVQPDGALGRVGTGPRAVLPRSLIVTLTVTARAIGTLLKRRSALGRPRPLGARRTRVAAARILLSAERQPVGRWGRRRGGLAAAIGRPSGAARVGAAVRRRPAGTAGSVAMRWFHAAGV